MIRQIFKLTRLQLLNLFGINEFRHTKDKGKKKRYLGLAAVWLMVVLMVAAYVSGISFGIIKLDMGNILPMYLYTIASILILFFTIFKAGSVLFSMKGYDIIVSLPVSKTAIVISRFLTMYVTNLLFAMLIMIPGIGIYGVLETPDISFYGVCIVGTVFLPLLPLTIASILGAVITGISARFRHKSIVSAILTIALLVGIMGATMTMPEEGISFSEELLKSLASDMQIQIGKFYPPAQWFNEAVCGKSIYILAVVGIPLCVFVIFVAVLQRFFGGICTLIGAKSAKKNYKIQTMKSGGVIKALWKKELKGYFSSSVYVTNTVVGYVLAVVMTAGVFFMGADKIGEMLGIGGFTEIFARVMPWVIAVLMSMTSMTSCSVSMEGKTIWQIQTLPIKSRHIYLSKIIANLTVAAPFYVAAVVFACLTVKGDVIDYIWIAVIPACYVIFTAVSGIVINLAFPVLDWDNEVRVVKQSASTFVAMVVGVVSGIIPAVCAVVFGENAINIVRMANVAILAAMTLLMYSHIGKRRTIV